MTRFGPAILLVLTSPLSSMAQDRVLGLLQLPEVFSTGACVPFEPRPVPIFAEREGVKPIGTIEVDENWSFAPHGGCEGLQVRVHRGAARAELPTREYDYEAPAAIVLERSGLWFRIRLDEGTAWVAAPSAGRFLALADLYEEFVGVTFINDGFAGELSAAPVGTVASPPGVRVKAGQSARVIETRQLAGGTWVHVEVLSHSICDSANAGPPDVVGEGWLPAYQASGEPTIWFSSRGC